MTRVVVLGPYPPAANPAADTVLDAVRALRAGGLRVTVVSLEPSAAPAWGDPTRRAGARRVARAVRDAECVVWFTPDGARPAPVARRALARVGVVERRAIAPHPATATSWTGRVRRLRAGTPTWVRTRWPGRAWLRPARRSG